MTYDMVRSAGSDTKMQTFNNKNIIRKNKLFDSSRWNKMSMEEKSAKWKVARSSSQAKKVRQIGTMYMDKVRAMKAVCLAGKEQTKKKKRERALALLEKCKAWGGPVTENIIGELGKLTADQLLVEVRYLRATVVPNIREKRKEGEKFVKFNKEELSYQIQNSIRPTTDVSVDVENLISHSLGLNNGNESRDHTDEESKELKHLPENLTVETENTKNENNEESTSTSSLPVGLIGQFSGPFNEVRIGVVISVGKENMLQVYESKRYGFVPALTEPEAIQDWKLLEEINEYEYVQYPTRPDMIFLKF